MHFCRRRRPATLAPHVSCFLRLAHSFVPQKTQGNPSAQDEGHEYEEQGGDRATNMRPPWELRENDHYIRSRP